ncbi:MAG: hypothetical protein L0Z49_07490 [Actinobacteria bacterium]|nr:hypothetical protein [Actinomycetota bacterium]
MIDPLLLCMKSSLHLQLYAVEADRPADNQDKQAVAVVDDARHEPILDEGDSGRGSACEY